MPLAIALGVLLAVTLFALMRPLLSRQETAEGGSASDVFAAQLDELEADRARGVIADADAEAARAEIARRLLRSREQRPSTQSEKRARWPALAVVFFVPLFSLGLYFALGAPGERDQPLASRVAPADPVELAALVDDAQARLDASPDDGAGWAAIAPAYQRLGRFEDAANAFARANAILGESAARLAGQGQSLAMANDGTVGPEARALFERAMALDETAVLPAIFLAVAARQDGDFVEAGERWRRLIERSNGTEPWLEVAAAEFSRMSGDGTRTGPRLEAVPESDVAASAPGPSGEGQPPAQGTAPQSNAPPRTARDGGVPSPDAVAAAAALPEAERARMIETMVSRLAQRLESEGGSAEEWARLITSYGVLGRPEDAAAAREAARLALPPEAFATLPAPEGPAQ